MGSLILRIRTWWETADRTQRLVTTVGGTFLVVLLGLTFYFASRPKFEILFGGLSPADQGMVVAELQKLGISSQYDARGTVLVPSSQVAEARAGLAVAGKMPNSGHGGYADLDKIGMMNTPKVEQERIKAGIEQELAASVEQVAGVGSARVHITLGDDSPFLRERKPPTASIFVTPTADGALGADQARAISRLVANAVPKLTTQNVAVITSDGRTLFDGQEDQGSGARAERKVQAEIAESKRREQEIQNKLDVAFGRGNTVVSVDLAMDFNPKSIQKVEVSPSEGPINKELNTEEMSGGGAGPGGTPFGAATDPSAPAAGAGPNGDRSYTSKQVLERYDRNVTQTSIEESAGELKSMAINVLVNKTKVTDDAPVTSFLNGYLGPKLGDPNFSVNVTSLEFDTTAQKAAETAAAATASKDRSQQMVSLLPILALVVVGFLVIRAIGKAARPDVLVTALPDGRVLPLGAGGMALGHDTGGHGVHRGGAGSTGAGGAGSHPALGSGSDGEPHFEDEPEIEGYDPVTGQPIRSIRSKVNVPLEQIKKLAKERPSTVAMLLKSWMLEERR